LDGNALSLSAQQITVRPTACEALTAHMQRDDMVYLACVDISENAVVLSGLNAPGQLDLDINHKFFSNRIAAGERPGNRPYRYFECHQRFQYWRRSGNGQNSLDYFNNESSGDTQSHAIAVECQKKHDAATCLRACSRLPHIPDALILGPQHCALL